MVICLAGMVPGIAGLILPSLWLSDQHTIYVIALIASFTLGFFVMSAGPIGFQYAAEVCHPAPESSSQGILLWIGQLSGMLFVTGMSVENHSMLNTFMYIFVALSIVSFLAVLRLKESPMMKA